MRFYNVWIRGIRGIFTWHSNHKLEIGARVQVKFRGKLKMGIVTAEVKRKPSFRTQEVVQVFDEKFISSEYLEIAKEVAYENITDPEKVFNLMIPEKFLKTENPAKKEIYYSLNSAIIQSISGRKNKNNAKKIKLSGKNQLSILDFLRKETTASEEELLTISSKNTIQNLAKKGILLKKYGKIIPAQIPIEKIPRKVHKLKRDQAKALQKIEQKKYPSLLFGVTGSGKTEIYKNLAKNLIDKNSEDQVLFLLPEISLTPQLISEFRGIFGKKIAVWHSKLSAGEKIQEWARCIFGEAQILIGARSAIFVPLKNPQLIILDEEHEWTFKSEFSPRFWTHNVAEKIAEKFEAKLVLGSATPRLESFEKCSKKEWQLVELPNRINNVELPKISIIDLKNEGIKGNYSPLSEKLEEAIQKSLAQKKQVILFLNRRGFFGSTTCKKCGKTIECPDCSFPLKLHKSGEKEMMICHICGHLATAPKSCPHCQSPNFEFRGWGTQQVESILHKRFPSAKIIRADADSTTRKNSFHNLLEKFRSQEADILLGTQMIAKGLDFENVDLVGIILADTGLTLPDFRSEERVFQLLTQVAGRAGRRKNRGKIIMQTLRPEEKVFQFVRQHDTVNFINWQKEHRQKMLMPPFIHLAKITFSRPKKEEAFLISKKFAEFCRKKLGQATVDWAPAFFPRSYNQYHFHVFIRLKSREKLIYFLDKIPLPYPIKIDINPASLL